MKKLQVKFFVLTAMLWLGVVSAVSGSEFDNLGTFAAGQVFYNVDGSSGDTYVNARGNRCDAWIDFWFYHMTDGTGLRDNCNPYNINSHIHGSTNIPCAAAGSGNACSGPIIGGHVVRQGTNRVQQYAIAGRTDIYIVPICQSHNARGAAQMTVSNANYPSGVPAVQLKDYHM